MKRRFLSSTAAVAEAVREGRAEAHLTQAQLATKAGVGRRFIVDLEAGHERAELAKVLGVLEALDIHAVALPTGPAKSDEGTDLAALVRGFA